MGNNLIRFLLKKYPDARIVNYSRRTYVDKPRSHEELLKNPRFVGVKGDINNVLLFKETLEKYKVNLIYHLAASTHVDRSFIYPEEFFKANIEGTFSILEVLRRMKKKPLLIYMSTDEVFGDVSKGYCKEQDVRSPRNPYSAAKASAEMYCNAYVHSYKVPIIIARSMNMFGPYQHPEKLIAKICTRCIANKSFTLYKGGSVRGWIYVKDSCSAVDTIATKGKVGEIYHIPPDEYLSVPEVANTILRIAGKEHLLTGYVGRRLKDDERYSLDGSKVQYELKWRAPTTFEVGIKETLTWFRKHKWYWCGLK